MKYDLSLISSNKVKSEVVENYLKPIKKLNNSIQKDEGLLFQLAIILSAFTWTFCKFALFHLSSVPKVGTV